MEINLSSDSNCEWLLNINWNWANVFCCRMFENRVPHMLDNDYIPYSALDIFVKDLVWLISTITNVFARFELCDWVIIRFLCSNYNHLQGIVSRECLSRRVPLHISTVAHQLFLAGTLWSFLFKIYMFKIISLFFSLQHVDMFHKYENSIAN